MASRNINFAKGEYYHIYNRGVDKRDIVLDSYDSDRFVQCLDAFNDVELTGSLYELSFLVNRQKVRKKLVNIIVYCLNPNHFHLIVEQLAENGISKFMHRLGGGYSWYFNNKYERKGALFQGKFKAKHIDSNDYLLYVSTYVNLNDRVHKLGGKAAKLVRSSWDEYMSNKDWICKKQIILNQFDSMNDYKAYCESSLALMIENKSREELEVLFHE